MIFEIKSYITLLHFSSASVSCLQSRKGEVLIADSITFFSITLLLEFMSSSQSALPLSTVTFPITFASGSHSTPTLFLIILNSTNLSSQALIVLYPSLTLNFMITFWHILCLFFMCYSLALGLSFNKFFRVQ